MWPFNFIIFAFNTPSAFPLDWKDWLVNQLGHVGVVGAIPAVLGAYFAPDLVIMLADAGGPVWPAVAIQWIILILTGFLYGLWEYAQYRHKGASDADCLADWGFVMLGHLTTATLNPVLAIILTVFIASGSKSRSRKENFFF